MSGNQQAFQKAMNDGHSAAWDQDWKTAAGYYQQALSEFPDHPGALTSLGLALFELQDFEQAVKIYRRLTGLTPEDPVPFEKLARIFERTGQLPDAVKCSIQAAELHLKARDVEKSIENWVRVTSLQPENMTAHSRLAMIYERIGKKAESVTEYLSTASLLQENGENSKATQAVQYALTLMPGSAEATQALQLLKKGQNLPRPARPRGGTGPMRMADVKKLEPKSSLGEPSLDPIAEARQKAMVQLAALLFDQAEDTTLSSQSSRRGINSLVRGTGGLVLDQSDRTRILLHLGQAIESQTHGDEQQAAEELERVQQIGLSHPGLYYNLGLLLSKIDNKKALRSLQKSVRNPEFALASYLLMGQIHFQEGKFTEAAQSYLQALRNADVETAPLEHADELSQLYEPILESQSKETDPVKLKTLCETIKNQLLRPDWRELLQKARQQLPVQSADAPPMPLSEMLLESRSGQVIEAMAQIRILASQKKTRSAMEEAFRALNIAPTYMPLHVQIGDLLFQEGLVQEAMTKYLLITDLYTLRGEANQAVQLLNRIAQISPMDVTVRQRLIDMLISQGRTDEAVQQYIDLADVYYRLAELDLTRQTYLTALRLAQQSANNRQWAHKILSSIADIDMQRLDWRQALRMFEQLRTLQPEDKPTRKQIIEIHQRLGQEKSALDELDQYIGYLETQHHRDAAIDFLKELLIEQPGKIDFLRRLFDLYRRSGQLELAVAQLDAIADAYASAANAKMAMATVEEIIALNPPNKAEYLKVLEELKNMLN